MSPTLESRLNPSRYLDPSENPRHPRLRATIAEHCLWRQIRDLDEDDGDDDPDGGEEMWVAA